MQSIFVIILIMALSSNMLPLGTKAPAFTLPDVVKDTEVSFDTFPNHSAYLVMFICRHCPYVIHIQQELVRLGVDYLPRRVGLVAISSNDAVRYPEDSAPQLREMAVRLAFNFPLCYDETQEVARAFDAACTPDFFLFDANRILVYRGQLDDSRPGNGRPVTGRDLRSALEAVLSGTPVSAQQQPSVGCGIKWK